MCAKISDFEKENDKVGILNGELYSLVMINGIMTNTRFMVLVYIKT